MRTSPGQPTLSPSTNLNGVKDLMEAHVAVGEEVVLVGARKHRHHHPIVLRQRDPASSRIIFLSLVESVSEAVEW